MTVSKEWLDAALSAWTIEAERDTTGYGGEVLAALTELASRRAAGEGAVTVEGWMYREEGGSFTFTPANMGGMERWESVTVAIRRRP